MGEFRFETRGKTGVGTLMAEFDKVLIYREMRDLGRRAEVGAGLALVEAWALLSRQSKKKGKAKGGKGLACRFSGIVLTRL